MKRNQTKTAIAEAFISLLWEHAIDRITVQMITEKAGCSRKTFYYYFTDIYDLSRYVCDRKLRVFLESHMDVASVRDAFQALMAYMDAERTVILNLFRGYGKEALEGFTWQSTEYYTREFLSNHPGVSALSAEDLEAVIHMYTYMLFGMMVDWLDNNMAGDYVRTLDVALEALPLLLDKLAK